MRTLMCEHHRLVAMEVVDDAVIEREIQKSGPRTLMFRLRPEHIRGKLVNEA